MTPYLVPALPALIPADPDTASWYAATRMMADWRYRRASVYAPDPDEQDTPARERRGETRLSSRIIRELAQGCGLHPVLPLRPVPTPTLLAQWLRRHGPIWTDAIDVDWNGVKTDGGHAVVIGGVDTNPTCPRIYVLDPLPAPRGHEGWRPYRHLMPFGAANDFGEARFLCCS
jgi:hypothetical protein